MNEVNDLIAKIRNRIMKGNRTLYALHETMKSKLIQRNAKVAIYKTLIRPVVTYGCETWTLTKKTEDILAMFERKVLRRIYGPVREDTGWRIRYNHELIRLYSDTNIVDYIKLQRLR